jgi:hypothetical protein
MLHIQAASAEAISSDSITVVKYGERAFSQIRRFVIVEVRRGFVYAWYVVVALDPRRIPDFGASPITTYSGRGTLKHGCVPREHSAVFLQDQYPMLLPNEYLEKEPICIIPAEAGIRLDSASRLHYSKAWPVEMNVKVKDIGEVDPKDLGNLLRYYRDENNLRG